MWVLCRSEKSIKTHSIDNEWYNEWQRVATSGTTSDNEWQWMTTSDTTGDNEWERMTASGATNKKEWKRVRASIALYNYDVFCVFCDVLLCEYFVEIY